MRQSVAMVDGSRNLPVINLLARNPLLKPQLSDRQMLPFPSTCAMNNSIICRRILESFYYNLYTNLTRHVREAQALTRGLDGRVPLGLRAG